MFAIRLPRAVARTQTSRRIGVIGLFAILVSAAAATSEAAATINMTAVSVTGPVNALQDATVQVKRVVSKTGIPYDDEFAYKIYLSTNDTISSGDREVFSSPSTLFTNVVNVNLPSAATLPTGLYFWGIIVDAEPFENMTGDNIKVGNKVWIGSPPDLHALSIAGPSSLEIGEAPVVGFGMQQQGPLVSGAIGYRVMLSSDSIITSADKELAHLTTTSLVNSVTLPPISASIAPGTYFFGMMIDTVFGEVDTGDNVIAGNQVQIAANPVLPSLETFSPGQILVGSFSAPGQERVLQFFGNAGKKFVVKAKNPFAAGVKLAVKVLRPDGSLLGNRSIENVKGRKKARFLLDATGMYQLVLSAIQPGSYTVKTKLKGAAAASTKKAMLSESQGEQQSFDLSAAPGSAIDVTAMVTRAYRGERFALDLLGPDGRLVHHTEAVGEPNAEIELPPVEAGGTYRLVVSGIHGEKAMRLIAKVLAPAVEMK